MPEIKERCSNEDGVREYYPIFLDMTDRPCLVVGGSPVAERKVEALLGVGARVTVVSPVVTARLVSWEKRGKIRHLRREYQWGDLIGYQLAFVATDDGEVNATVAWEGHERGVWVNAADDPANCDFILPSVLRRGELVVAVGTGGASPALSRAIREELEGYFTADYAVLARMVAEVRRELSARPGIPDAETWRRALDGDLRRLLAEGKQEEARVRLLQRLFPESGGGRRIRGAGTSFAKLGRR